MNLLFQIVGVCFALFLILLLLAGCGALICFIKEIVKELRG